MTSDQKQLEEGARFHRLGKLQQAEEIYRAILKNCPRNANALHLLGVVHHQNGDNESASAFIQKAIAIIPDASEYRTNLGSVLLAMGKTEEAIEAYRDALKYTNDDSDIYINLGNLFSSSQRPLDAIDSYQHAVRISPLRGDIWNQLGRMFQQVEQWEEAAGSFQNAMQLAPNDFEPINNLGVVREKLGDYKTAFDCFSKAALLCPSSADVHFNAGNLARRLYRYEEACHHYQQAMLHQERFAEASVNLAVTHLAMEEYQNALEVNERFLEDCPDHIETKFNQSLVHLRLKNFKTGWKEYEWRWEYGDTPKRNASPEWDGSNLTEKTILVTAEQGIGDQVMFSSCLYELVNQAGNVIVECEERLAPIFERSFPEITIVPVKKENQSLYTHRTIPDFEIPIGSLPGYFRSTENDFPQRERFLFPDDRRRDYWIDRLSELTGALKIGISWRGGKDEETQTMRSIPLKQWQWLSTLSDVALVNLQYGDSLSERQKFCNNTGSKIHHFEEIDPLKELDDFAALISALDMVISIDNSTVHFAGALGTPCSVLLPHYADWRWFTNDKTSLWYPSISLFRQKSVTGWIDVFDDVTELIRSQYSLENRTSQIVSLKFSPLPESA